MSLESIKLSLIVSEYHYSSVPIMSCISLIISLQESVSEPALSKMVCSLISKPAVIVKDWAYDGSAVKK